MSKSCYRDLNPGPLPYQGSALPLSYNSKECGQRWIRTTEGINQQIYSLPHLATLVFALSIISKFRASCRIRTNDPEITNHVLWPAELKRRFAKCNRFTYVPFRWLSETAAKLGIIFIPTKF